jgi:hypothetical protein
MKRSKFSDSQIIDAVKRVESGIGVPDISLELGVTQPSVNQSCTSCLNSPN